MYATDHALNHFDGYYSKVYGSRWPSIRLGLLSPNKFAAVVNPFCEPDRVEQQFRLMRKLDLRRYYEKHWKHSERYKLRMAILKERRSVPSVDKARTWSISPGQVTTG